MNQQFKTIVQLPVIFIVFFVVIALCPAHSTAASGEVTGSSAYNPKRFVAPADAGLIDVTKAPYFAIPNDDQDDTAAIQRALSDHPNSNAVIYLPDGVYIITDTLRWPAGTSGSHAQKRTHLQGQSTEGVVLRVPDAHPHFRDEDQPRAVIWTGEKPAQRFRNSIRNLTVDVGLNNPGAIAVQYIASNQGSVRHLDLIAGEGSGLIGLDLGYTDEQGPCLIKGVRIYGFAVGLSAKTVVNSITIEDLLLENQRQVGLSNDGQVISIRGLMSRNRVPAIENLNRDGLITLLDSELVNLPVAGHLREHMPAIRNVEGAVLVRNTLVNGYASGVENLAEQGTREHAPAGNIIAYASHRPMHATPAPEGAELGDHWRLSAPETPLAPQPPVDRWAGPHQFGGSSTDEEDDTDAVRAAIASGAEVIYFPHSPKGSTGWMIQGEIHLPAHVRRVTALEGRVVGDAVFVVAEMDEYPIVFDRFDFLYRRIGVENRTSRTVTLSGITFDRRRLGYWGAGLNRGDLFLEDVCGNAWFFDQTRVWARQLNPESKGTKVVNRGGTFWVLGLKTEQGGTIVKTTNNGHTEINGGFIYSQGAEKTSPMFFVEGDKSTLTATVAETTWTRNNFPVLIHVVRRGPDYRIDYDDDVYWRSNHAAMIPLLTVSPP